MRRFFTEPENIENNRAKIIEDAPHIERVLRLEEGCEIILFDGTGYEYIAELESVSSKECVALIKEKKFSELEPKTRVVVYQGIPKSGKMESIIQKSVELGVLEIVPTAMDRCVSKIENPKKGAEKVKRWNKIAVEAAKQCGRGCIPKVSEPVSFKDAIDRMSKSQLALMPYEVIGHLGGQSIKEVLGKKKFLDISVIIGPEGGFSDAEAEYAKEKGIFLVGLGKRILRTETVSSAVLAMIMYENDEV